MTASVIDIDLDEPSAASSAASTTVPFLVWLRAWRPEHPVAFGAAIGCIIAAVAAIIGLTAIAVRPSPAPAVPDTPSRIYSVITVDADEVATTVLRQDADGLMVSRGEILGSEPALLADIVGISVTVRGAQAHCSITVDGRVVDEAAAVAEGSMTTCVWFAGR